MVVGGWILNGRRKELKSGRKVGGGMAGQIRLTERGRRRRMGPTADVCVRACVRGRDKEKDEQENKKRSCHPLHPLFFLSCASFWPHITSHQQPVQALLPMLPSQITSQHCHEQGHSPADICCLVCCLVLLRFFSLHFFLFFFWTAVSSRQTPRHLSSQSPHQMFTECLM